MRKEYSSGASPVVALLFHGQSFFPAAQKGPCQHHLLRLASPHKLITLLHYFLLLKLQAEKSVNCRLSLTISSSFSDVSESEDKNRSLCSHRILPRLSKVFKHSARACLLLGTPQFDLDVARLLPVRKYYWTSGKFLCLFSFGSVSYTHLTLPTICSV
eukprot:TRINITY_DN7916_c0_g1_i3.p2 TRINITY_DN7916_c0_g1~~TRINITY_DN7916_c0_g1_i3.p2  ORF type:complete len:158 (-),score=1.97 TRINITY_DN7916_c0_g1_i3:47-520(-)